MNISDGDTDWKYTFGSSTNLPKMQPEITKWQTSGSPHELGDINYTSFTKKPDISSRARKVLSTVQNEDQRIKAETLLLLIQSILTHNIDISELPPLRALQTDDESLIFEWVFPHFRVGFSIEKNSSESGWYLVSDDTAGGIIASGKILDITGSEIIIFWLLQYISLNY